MRKLCPNFDQEDGLDTVLEVPIPEEMFTRMAPIKCCWITINPSSSAARNAVHRPIKDCSIFETQVVPQLPGTEALTAKYIVQQYIAATGGQQALYSVNSMYAIGQVKLSALKFTMGDESVKATLGGFVLWQKNPDLWYLELVMSNIQGPRANLFLEAVCIGEKIINNEDCFILKLETSPTTLKARSSDSFEIIHHTIWGYFSQRTGLLVKFEDSHLLRMKAKGNDNAFWETSMESEIEDNRYIDGIHIADSGKTMVTLFRYGAGSANHKRKMEETWMIDEIDFNIWGLSMDCFLPPLDLKKEQDSGEQGM
ncbi:hypothetical protein GIB67_023616 [Kingdonia uniflora]|uniref:Uncharacterized protein n=1 Tax=Kingdonia uniflora TaxID=39325 RepID=A0A7J7L537_9MAGN|nr:hypothetical protein GIB67_023616 [Kingdonia uniflora]